MSELTCVRVTMTVVTVCWINVIRNFYVFTYYTPYTYFTYYLELQDSAKGKGHFVLYNCLVLGHSKYSGIQRVYCNQFLAKPFHGSQHIDLVMTTPATSIVLKSAQSPAPLPISASCPARYIILGGWIPTPALLPFVPPASCATFSLPALSYSLQLPFFCADPTNSTSMSFTARASVSSSIFRQHNTLGAAAIPAYCMFILLHRLTHYMT